jgi:yopX protein
MRTIKFKGYSIEDNKFIFGYLFKDPITFNCYIIEENSTKDTMNIVLVEKDSIGQFTGLCDIGGNEIYEGDILSYDFTERFCNNKYIIKGQSVVSYFEAVGGFVIYDKDDTEDGDFIELSHIEIIKRKLKVVDNIYKLNTKYKNEDNKI